MKIKPEASRAETLKFIAESALFGNLGLFVGAGFSKAVMNSRHRIALSWGELLSKVTEELEINDKSIEKEGYSYPQIASQIVKTYAEHEKVDYLSALHKVKEQIASLTSWYPDREQRARFSRYFKSIKPAWIITTNYELIIESVLTGRSITIGPRDELIKPSNLIPVFHLHGIRTDPDSIIITQEDYVTLFRPNEYRQLKLALTIKESTMLIIGYGLGDVNVLTAMDWSANVFPVSNTPYPRDVIQIIRTKEPKLSPYRDSSGILILETKEIEEFLNEFIEVLEQARKERESLDQSFAQLEKELNDPQSNFVEKFIDDAEWRRRILDLLAQSESAFISGFMEFLFACVDKTWERAAPNGAFFAYDQNLRIVLDVLERFDVHKISPALFESLASNLERVGYYVGDDPGQSFDAGKTWDKRKTKLPDKTIAELKNYAEQNGCFHILRLLRGIETAEKWG